MAVTRKLLLPVLVFFALVLIGAVTVFTLDATSVLSRQEENEIQQLHQTFLAEIEAMRSLSLALAESVATNNQVQAAFASGDRNQLTDLTLPTYEVLEEQFGVTQFGFHLAPAKSFLRLHQLDHYDDDLATYRFTVLDANLDRRPTSGLEIGRAGLGMRGVVPISFKDTHIGTVEFGLDVGTELLNTLKDRSGADWNILLRRQAVEVILFDKETQIELFGGEPEMESGPTEDLLLQATTLEIPIFSSPESYTGVLGGKSTLSQVTAGEHQYTVNSAPLLDFNNEVIGVVDIVTDHTAVILSQQRRIGIGSAATLAALIIGGIGMTFIATRVLQPIGTLTQTAQAIADGDLTRSVPIGGQDEIGMLASAFNTMNDQIRGLIGSLEQRVADRTVELEKTTADLGARSAELEQINIQQEQINQQLQEAIRQSQHRAALLQASNEVSHAISQVLELDELLPQVADLISRHFGFYHAGIFLIDEAGRYAVLRAASSVGGKKMLARKHKLAVGTEGIVGYVTQSGQSRIALDVGIDAVHFDTQELPATRSEMAVPLRVGEQVIGALDVQSTEEAAFGPEDIAALSALGDQIATAIRNTRLFEQTREAVALAEAAQQRYLRQAWSSYIRTESLPGYEFTQSGVELLGDADLPEIKMVLEHGQPVTLDPTQHPFTQNALAAPIVFRNQIIGALVLHEEQADRRWNQDEIALVQEVANQIGLALENARLFEHTERRAQREALIGQIVSRVRQRPDVDGIMQTAVRELGKALGSSRAYIHLTSSIKPPASQQAGDDGQ